jgi:nucleoside-diphosphate-sugar epimerase/phosphohistidine swiveling domain-containing protein
LLPKDVEFRAGDIRDADAVAAAMKGCDVVAHCAWAIGAMYGDPAEREINVGGTENVLAAMHRTGTRRIVFASSSTAYGPRPDDRQPLAEDTPLAPHPEHEYGKHKDEVERLLGAAPIESVLIRSTIAVGRRIDNRVRNLLAGPSLIGVRGEEQLWQVVHADDVGRLFALACESGPTGPVNLAAPEVMSVDEVGEALGRRVLRVPGQAIDRIVKMLWTRHLSPVSPADLAFLRHQPILDTTKLWEGFGFRCAWSGREAVEDTRLALIGVIGVGDRAVELPSRRSFRPQVEPADSSPTDDVDLERAGPAESEGEFDTRVHPRFPTFTSTNLSEALPGPATPLSLTTVAPGIQAALTAAAEFVGMEGVAGFEARTRFQGIFAHRLFVNVTCGAAIGELSPGWDAQSITDQYLGRHAEEVDVTDPATLPIDRPTSVREKVGAAGRMGARAVGLAAGYRRDVDEMAAQVARLERLVQHPKTVSDERLEAMFSLACDIMRHGWRLAGLGAILAGAATTTAEKAARVSGVVERVGATLTSARGLLTTERLAALASARPEVVDALTPGPSELSERVAKASPEFAAEVDRALATIGHRGPAECELAAASFSDDPDLLLRTVAKAIAAPQRRPCGSPGEVPRRGRLLARYACRVTGVREENRDRVVRTIWVMRRLAREHGQRLADRGIVESSGDVFYLTADELFDPPPNTPGVVERRRAERARLAAVALPVAFTAPWQPVQMRPVLNRGDRLTGIGASPGTARGLARVVTPETVDDLQPGEVLVAHVTDVGYTPMFGHAAAVVTDIGGLMSHAAVVAREFGIPAVVDTAEATRRMADGMVLEVDGATGVVTVIS